MAAISIRINGIAPAKSGFPLGVRSRMADSRDRFGEKCRKCGGRTWSQFRLPLLHRQPSCAACVFHTVQNTPEIAMMMNELREGPMPEVENGATPKIVAAALVLLGVAAIGAYSYETGTWSSAPTQAAASQPATPAAAVASAAPSDTTPPQSTAADLPPPPVSEPVKETAAPVKQAAAPTASKSDTAPAVKVARTQAPAPAQRTASVQQPTVQPEIAAPAPAAAEPPAPQTAPVSPTVTAAPQEAPAQPAPEQPAEPAAAPQ
jgi:hypothetical protein